jgi:hypothetical protein
MNIPLEIKVIEKFVIKDKQERYIQFVSSGKNRKKLLNDLPHFGFFNWQLLEEVEGTETQVIHERLKQIRGNKSNCYIICENSDLDQKQLSINDALGRTINSDQATILVFGDAELIYYEGEPPKNRFISKLQ